ncbi:MAG: trypsin-like peptidase domain-containing protein [Planctomycetota bacterium]
MIRWYGPSLLLLLTVATVMLIGPGLARKVAWNHGEAKITQVRQDLVESPTLSTLSEAFSKVSEVVEPSVVHVQTLGPSARRGGGFFSRFDPLEPMGNGSGWVYAHTPSDESDPQNYILTNHHVVDGASRIRIRFADGGEYTAAVVGSDALTDVAVLSVPGGFLHPAAVRLEPVRKGEIVFAFGSPLRFDFSVSQGIVSASGRRLDISNSGKYEDFIQTDAAINPGNSGGPLTDIYGRVVGMNTAIASTRGRGPGNGGGFMGLGFAIPAEMVADVATRLIEDGSVRRGYLGVTIRGLTPDWAEAFGYDADTQGVLIEHPIGGGPADRAGLRPGDVVTAVAGEPVADVDALRFAVASYPPGETIDVTVRRGDTELDVDVALDELPGREATAGRRAVPGPRLPPGPSFRDDRLRALGIEAIADIMPRSAGSARVRPVTGVLVTDVRFGSVAATRRVLPQSLIVEADGQPVDDVAALLDRMNRRDADRPLRLTLLNWDPSLGEFVTRFALLDVGG